MDSIPRIRRELVVRFQKLVRTKARALGIRSVDLKDWVDEIVGEGIAVALSQQEEWDPKRGKFLYWAFLKTRTLVHKELKHEERHRKTLRRLQALAPTKEPRDRTLDRLILREELFDILGQLSQMEQEALTLYYLNGIPVRILADILGKPPKTVYDLLDRARVKARARSAVQVEKKLPKPRPLTLFSNGEVSFEEERRRRRAQQEAIDRLYGEA